MLPARRGVPELARITPSGKSIVLGLALLLAAVGGYYGARETSVFAVRAVDVRGGTPALRAEVRHALTGEVGASLLTVDSAAIDRRLSAIPSVRAFTFDRAFPHTLRVTVAPERPVLVVRRANQAYLVAATGRVLRELSHPHLSSLPRLYVSKDVQIEVGHRLPAAPAAAAGVLAPLAGAPLPGGVRFVETGKRGLLLVLGEGFELRLGDAGDVRLKLAIARRILRATGAAGAGPGYLDVSVPERPVLSSESQVAG